MLARTPPLEVENARLRHQVATLREEARQLRDLLEPPLLFPASWGISPQRERILRIILRASPYPICSVKIAELLGPGKEPRSVRRQIGHLRVGLRRLGLVIENRRGSAAYGYWITRDTAQRIREASE